jgi:hypothetical protein
MHQHPCCMSPHPKDNAPSTFNMLPHLLPWHTCCCRSCMDINTKVLSEVAYQLENGNPWWGMALCNRYLSVSSPLRRAIALRFAQKIGQSQAGTDAAQALIRGSDTEALRRNPQQLGSRVVRSHRPLPTPTNKRTQRLRLATRTRAHQLPRYSLNVGAQRSSMLTSINPDRSYLSAVGSR